MWSHPAPPEPFEITGEGSGAVAQNDRAVVCFAGPGDARMFRRRTIRLNPDGDSTRVEAAVAELDGVRTYVHVLPGGAVGVVVSRLDLNL